MTEITTAGLVAYLIQKFGRGGDTSMAYVIPSQLPARRQSFELSTGKNHFHRTARFKAFFFPFGLSDDSILGIFPHMVRSAPGEKRGMHQPTRANAIQAYFELGIGGFFFLFFFF